ncbi:Protein of unknown function [Solimonas aquatica]|uniref:DUF3450 domain-containing protein n=1 Tax=Solimonas aquatica TaxID=489703 RepID=A0A1H9HYN8_9GAMM|nr:DUF3450 domain-containing protein [Solimonas aquatica]SEQ67460.1 Protein of unknown function [Solimonas aquatica]
MARPEWRLLFAAVAAVLCATVWAQADTVGKVLDLTQQSQRAAADSQKRVEQLDDQTRAMLERYRAALWQTQQLNAYAEQLNGLLAEQQNELAALQQQSAELDRAGQDLLPLMLRMTDSLEQFIKLDLPFLKEERTQRIAALKQSLSDAQLSAGEKFRRLLEAYQIEIDYGRNLGVEQLRIGDSQMDVLRVGRVALYALSPDGAQAQVWDAAAARWQPLPRSARAQIREGIKMARELAPANLLELPVPVAVAQP